MNLSILSNLLLLTEVQEFLQEQRSNPFDPLKYTSLLQQYSQEERVTLLGYLKLLPKIEERFQTKALLLCDSLAWQQSSGHEIAQYKASLIPQNAKVLDLCCGMGGDVFFLQSPLQVLGVDLSEERLKMYSWNMNSFALPYQIHKQDVTTVGHSCDVMLLDPDRRTQSKDKNWDLNSMSPNLEEVQILLQRYPNSLVKLPPAANPDAFWGKQPITAEYIGSRRDCRELLLKTGTFSHTQDTVQALFLPNLESFSATPKEIVECPRTIAKQSNYIIEPYKPIIRAQLVAPLAQKFGFTFLDFHIAYLSSVEKPLPSPFYQSFQILAILPKDRKKIQKELKKYDAGSLEIKKRGLLLEPEQERKKYTCKGKENLTLIYSRIQDKVTVFLCQRI